MILPHSQTAGFMTILCLKFCAQAADRVAGDGRMIKDLNRECGMRKDVQNKNVHYKQSYKHWVSQ